MAYHCINRPYLQCTNCVHITPHWPQFSTYSILVAYHCPNRTKFSVQIWLNITVRIYPNFDLLSLSKSTPFLSLISYHCPKLPQFMNSTHFWPIFHAHIDQMFLYEESHLISFFVRIGPINVFNFDRMSSSLSASILNACHCPNPSILSVYHCLYPFHVNV